MKKIEKLIYRIINNININLREFNFDTDPYVAKLIPVSKLLKFYAFYGITSRHPIYFHFSGSNLAGSYFLGKCEVDNSVVYKSDIRGDELRAKGDTFHYQGEDITFDRDQVVKIKDSFLIKTLVHNFSHDPEKLDQFPVIRTISTHFANIHGSPMNGCLLGPFSTVDLTTLHDCIIGTFSYLQAGEVSHERIKPGEIWIKDGNDFEFHYSFSDEILEKYISVAPGEIPKGIFMDFIEERKKDFQKIFDTIYIKEQATAPSGTALNRYAVIKGKCRFGDNVLVAQRAFIDNASLGTGANAQENCYIIHSHLEGYNVTAHGAKIIHAQLDKKVFVGFNSFLQGKAYYPLIIGRDSIVMPHTIIDLEESLTIPAEHIVWGYIRNKKDFEKNSISFEDLSGIEDEFVSGSMRFQGSGNKFVNSFKGRIEHILEENGAYCEGKKKRGHAQEGQQISYNIIQPYSMGPLKGIYPTIEINP